MIPRRIVSPDLSLSQVIKGGWHLAGGHGAIDHDQALADMAKFVEAGITSFDCANIYTGVEQMIGDFRRAYPSLANRIEILDKYVPDLADLPTLTSRQIEETIDRSLKRLGVERIDLVQFHWWDYTVPGVVEKALILERLRQAGKIAHLGVTNFDVPHLQKLLQAGVPITTHQIQYSLVDDRANHGMAEFCRAQNIGLLCFGTVLGGFMSERWLGADEPDDTIANRSLIKYKLIIDDFGGWALFQQLLGVLHQIAQKYDTDIATVGSRVMLDRAEVAGVIVGATNISHLASHEMIGRLALTEQDRAAIAAVTARRRGPLGDIYSLERDREGPHGRIMKYNLNKTDEPATAANS